MGFFDKIKKSLDADERTVRRALRGSRQAGGRAGQAQPADRCRDDRCAGRGADFGRRRRCGDRTDRAGRSREARRRQSLRGLVKEEIRSILRGANPPAGNGHRPHVVLIVGVNGTGKTTTVGKLARLIKESGKSPLICAADTFRAAAVEQLEIWATRAGVDIIRARDGRGSGRGGLRRDRGGQSRGARRGARRYRRPSAHARRI